MFSFILSQARDQLHEMNTNLVPHAFAALTLGFGAGSSLGRSRGSGGALTSGGAGDAFTSWHQLGSVLWNEGSL